MQTLENDADKEASGPLAIIQAVINTRSSRTRPDEWHTPEQVRAWLLQRRLLAGETPLSQGDLRRLLEVREALRELLRGNNGMPVAPEAIEALNHLAKHAPLVVHFRQDGQAELIPDIEGIDGVISTLLGIVFTALADGTWTRLKVCHNERCQKAFYDHSKNRSGTWCSMAKCGSRVKASTYRQRQQKGMEGKIAP